MGRVWCALFVGDCVCLWCAFSCFLFVLPCGVQCLGGVTKVTKETRGTRGGRRTRKDGRREGGLGGVHCL